MGDTITQIKYITKDGYYTLDTSLYVPVKFEGSVGVDNASITDGKATISTEGIPSDYAVTYTIDGLDYQVDGDTILFGNATPASYTLSVTDANGVYMGLSTTFELTTDVTPAQYDGTKLVKTDTASDEDFSNYLNNVASVTVNGTTYSASGKGSVAIISEDGSIDTSVTSGKEATPVFSGADTYEVTVHSAGYANDLTFTLNSVPEVTTDTTTQEPTNTDTNPTTTTTSKDNTSKDKENGNANTTNGSNNTTTTSTNSNNTTAASTSPATGSNGVAIPLTALAVALGSIVTFHKKRND
jgi:hypothetical protein